MKRKYIIATFFYCAGIFLMSSCSKPLDMGLPAFDGMDKIAHFIVYGGLAALISVGMRRSDAGVSVKAHFLIPVIFAILYGLSDEIHQIFVPLRTFDLLDLLADSLGAIAAQSVLWYAWSKGLFVQILGRYTAKPDTPN